jgi:hypothetical protein
VSCEKLKPLLIMMEPHTALQLVKLLPSNPQKFKSFTDTRCPAMDFPADAQKKSEMILHPEFMISRPYGLTEVGTVPAMLYHQRKQNDPSSVGFTFSWSTRQVRSIPPWQLL